MLLTLGVGCAGGQPALKSSLEARSSVGEFHVTYAELDAEAARRVQRSLERAGPALARWGELSTPVRVQVLPNHKALEDAVDRHGYGWLRAWARFDEVYVQSPRTWSLLGARQKELDELLLHELTHCLMYQRSATALSWARKRIPLWFREGMASYTAEQGYRWRSLEDLARHMEEHPDEDLLRNADALFEDQSDLVYGAAHHAFTFLVQRYGEDKVRELMWAMKRGPTFAPAFASVLGLGEEAFLEDFSRYVRLRGFRLGRLRHTVELPGRPAEPPASTAPAPP
jgi:hypothetical protein